MADELARLGLSNRSVRLIAGAAVWEEVARLVKPRSALVAAIAGVGAAGAGLVPFGRGASIVTNAGLDAVRAGITDPGILLGWVDAGATVFSLADLRTTVILAEGNPVFVVAGSGSAARSGIESGDHAVVISDDPDTVKEGRRALLDWRGRAGSPVSATTLREWLSEYGVDRPRRSAPAPVPAGPAHNSGSVAPPRLVSVPSIGASSGSLSRSVTVLPARVPPPTAVFAPASDAPAGPRPKTLTVTGIFRKGEPSPEAESRLAGLKAEHEAGDHIGVVEMFWWDLAPGSSNVRLYRDGEYVVGVDLGESGGRRQKRCPLWPPGRVLHTYTDGAAWPVRVYCYLLLAGTGEAPTLGDLQAGVLSIGEKLEFDRGYLRVAVIDTILGLWPDVSYQES